MSGHILIVEDTPHNLQLMTFLLEARGHEVRAAETGAAGLDAVAADRPDLVLMDLHLPDASGEEVLAQLRANPTTRDLRVVAVTAFAMVGDRERVLAAGFDDYMTKPLDPATFALDVERHLGIEGNAVPGPAPAPALTVAESPTPGSEDATVEETGRPVVLVVDDLATNVNLMQSILEPSGYRVAAAYTIADALRAAHRQRPDLILCDIHLGEESGFDLLSRLRADPDLATIPFAFLSSSAKPHSQVASDAADVAYFIARPMEPQGVLDVVAELLRPGIA